MGNGRKNVQDRLAILQRGNEGLQFRLFDKEGAFLKTYPKDTIEGQLFALDAPLSIDVKKSEDMAYLKRVSLAIPGIVEELEGLDAAYWGKGGIYSLAEKPKDLKAELPQLDRLKSHLATFHKDKWVVDIEGPVSYLFGLLLYQFVKEALAQNHQFFEPIVNDLVVSAMATNSLAWAAGASAVRKIVGKAAFDFIYTNVNGATAEDNEPLCASVQRQGLSQFVDKAYIEKVRAIRDEIVDKIGDVCQEKSAGLKTDEEKIGLFVEQLAALDSQLTEATDEVSIIKLVDLYGQLRAILPRTPDVLAGILTEQQKALKVAKENFLVATHLPEFIVQSDDKDAVVEPVHPVIVDEFKAGDDSLMQVAAEITPRLETCHTQADVFKQRLFETLDQLVLDELRESQEVLLRLFDQGKEVEQYPFVKAFDLCIVDPSHIENLELKKTVAAIEKLEALERQFDAAVFDQCNPLLAAIETAHKQLDKQLEELGDESKQCYQRILKPLEKCINDAKDFVHRHVVELNESLMDDLMLQKRECEAARNLDLLKELVEIDTDDIKEKTGELNTLLNTVNEDELITVDRRESEEKQVTKGNVQERYEKLLDELREKKVVITAKTESSTPDSRGSQGLVDLLHSESNEKVRVIQDHERSLDFGGDALDGFSPILSRPSSIGKNAFASPTSLIPSEKGEAGSVLDFTTALNDTSNIVAALDLASTTPVHRREITTPVLRSESQSSDRPVTELQFLGQDSASEENSFDLKQQLAAVTEKQDRLKARLEDGKAAYKKLQEKIETMLNKAEAAIANSKMPDFYVLYLEDQHEHPLNQVLHMAMALGLTPEVSENKQLTYQQQLIRAVTIPDSVTEEIEGSYWNLINLLKNSFNLWIGRYFRDTIYYLDARKHTAQALEFIYHIRLLFNLNEQADAAYVPESEYFSDTFSSGEEEEGTVDKLSPSQDDQTVPEVFRAPVDNDAFFKYVNLQKLIADNFIAFYDSVPFATAAMEYRKWTKKSDKLNTLIRGYPHAEEATEVTEVITVTETVEEKTDPYAEGTELHDLQRHMFTNNRLRVEIEEYDDHRVQLQLAEKMAACVKKIGEIEELDQRVTKNQKSVDAINEKQEVFQGVAKEQLDTLPQLFQKLAFTLRQYREPREIPLRCKVTIDFNPRLNRFENDSTDKHVNELDQVLEVYERYQSKIDELREQYRQIASVFEALKEKKEEGKSAETDKVKYEYQGALGETHDLLNAQLEEYKIKIEGHIEHLENLHMTVNTSAMVSITSIQVRKSKIMDGVKDRREEMLDKMFNMIEECVDLGSADESSEDNEVKERKFKSGNAKQAASNEKSLLGSKFWGLFSAIANSPSKGQQATTKFTDPRLNTEKHPKIRIILTAIQASMKMCIARVEVDQKKYDEQKVISHLKSLYHHFAKRSDGEALIKLIPHLIKMMGELEKNSKYQFPKDHYCRPSTYWARLLDEHGHNLATPSVLGSFSGFISVMGTPRGNVLSPLIDSGVFNRSAYSLSPKTPQSQTHDLLSSFRGAQIKPRFVRSPETSALNSADNTPRSNSGIDGSPREMHKEDSLSESSSNPDVSLSGGN